MGRRGNKAENGRIVNCHISLRLKQLEKRKSECLIIKCEQRQFSNRNRIVSSGSRWSLKCQGRLLHTPSRPVPSSLLEGQREFSALPKNPSTRNTSNGSTKESESSPRTEIRTSVLSMNPISSIIWLSRKKMHNYDTWARSVARWVSNWHSERAVCSGQAWLLGEHRTPRDTNMAAATAGLPEVGSPSFERQRPLWGLEEREERGEGGGRKEETKQGRRRERRRRDGGGGVRESSRIDLSQTGGHRVSQGHRGRDRLPLSGRGQEWQRPHTKPRWPVVGTAATPLPRAVASGTSPDHFVPWFSRSVRRRRHGPTAQGQSEGTRAPVCEGL